MHLLIADDHAGVRSRIASIIIESFPSAELSYCSNANDALSYLQRNTCDILIMDINMPGITGIEALRRLRSSSDLPVIIMSSNCENQYTRAALAAGANAFINKQSLGEKLQQTIEYIVKPNGFSTD